MHKGINPFSVCLRESGMIGEAMKRMQIVLIAAVFLLVFILVLNYYMVDGIFNFPFYFGAKGNTEFSNGFTASKFRNVKVGMSQEDVLHLLGEPISKNWQYVRTSKPVGEARVVSFEEGVVVGAYVMNPGDVKENTQVAPSYTENAISKVRKGYTENEVISLIGEPLEQFWVYSTKKKESSYLERGVVFVNGTVVRRHSDVYVD